MTKRPSLAEKMREAAKAPDPVERVPATATPSVAAPPERTRVFYAATRVGKKKVTAALAPSDHKRLRHLAVERDATTEELLTEAINDLFAKYGKSAEGEGHDTP